MAYSVVSGALPVFAAIMAKGTEVRQSGVYRAAKPGVRGIIDVGVRLVSLAAGLGFHKGQFSNGHHDGYKDADGVRSCSDEISGVPLVECRSIMSAFTSVCIVFCLALMDN